MAALPYTLAGLTYGLAGLAYSNVFQDGSSEFKYHEKYGSIEFERNPFAHRSFATGQVINYDKDTKIDDEIDSYDGKYLVNVSDHERHHIEQSNTYGIIFPFVYLFSGGWGVKENTFEQEADEKARIRKK